MSSAGPRRRRPPQHGSAPKAPHPSPTLLVSAVVLADNRKEKIVNMSMRFARSYVAEPEVPICVLTIPVLSRPGQDAGPPPPVIEVYASARLVKRKPDVGRGTPLTRAIQAEARLARAMSGAYEATRLAARSARLAGQGVVPRAQAEEVAAVAEAARVEVAEMAIASALEQRERLATRIATLDRQLTRAEMRASVASVLMARDAQVGATHPSQVPMFTLMHDGANPLRADVFEKDLLRLVSGQNVMLTSTKPDRTATAVAHLHAPAIDLSARLGRARHPAQDPSRVVHGMFLSVEILPGEGKVRLAVPGPSSALVARSRLR